jgi:hypothetical protein
MLKQLKTLVIVAVLAGLGFYVYANYLNACNQTLAYGIGSVDPRFGVTQEELATLAQEVEGVWESPFEKPFFQFDQNSEFKINLVFDERQQRTIDERNTRTDIQTQEQIYRSKVADYEAELATYNQSNASYDADVAAYEARLQKYNEQVDYWNKNGGAPAKEYQQIQQEKAALQRVSRSLEARRLQLNQAVTALNAQAAEINAMAKTLNLDVNAYNGTFGNTKEFDQGSYTGDEINIYQFSAKEDLRLVLAHEFGHALGLDHIDDPNAIMYYLMDKQNIKSLHLTDSDVSALKGACHIR